MCEHKTFVCLLVLGLSACGPVQEVSEDSSVPEIRFIPGFDRGPDAGLPSETRSATASLEALHRVPLPEWMNSYGDMWLYQQETTSTCPDTNWASHNMNCGPTSVAMVLNYLLNLDLDPACRSILEADTLGFHRVHAMTRWLYCDAGSHGVDGGYSCDDHASPGATESQMVVAMASEGIEADIQSYPPWCGTCPDIPDPYAIIVGNVSSGRLTLAHVNPCQYRSSVCGLVESHWVVVHGYDGDGVYIQDPGWRSPGGSWGSNRRITREEFVNAVNRVRNPGHTVYYDRVLVTVTTTLETIRRHPPGALVKRAGHPEIYLVDQSSQLRWLTTEDVLRSRRLYRDSGDPFGLVVTISEEEFTCYEMGPVIDWPITMRVTSCGDGGHYLTINDRGDVRKWPISGRPGDPLFRVVIASWGFRESEVLSGYAGCGYPTQFPQIYIRDGTVIHEGSSSMDGYVAYAGVLFDISPALVRDLGYDPGDVLEVPVGASASLTRGHDSTHPAITRVDTAACRPLTCDLPTISTYPDVGGGGGGGDADCDADHDGYFDAACGGTDCDDSHSETYPWAVEICDGRDNNCMNGVDEAFDLQWDDVNCGTCGNTCSGGAHCVSGACLAGGCSSDVQCDDVVSCTYDWCMDHVCRHYLHDDWCAAGQYCHAMVGCMPYGYCTMDDQCAYDVACTVDRCVGMTCVHTHDDSLCDTVHYCTPLYGCQLRDSDGDGMVDIDDCAPTDPSITVCLPASPDAGLPIASDAGMDAGVPDAGRDAGSDASMPMFDAGRDAGSDSGPPLPVCVPRSETCNGRDDDCDGIVDDGNPGGGLDCGSPRGVCRLGTLTCVGGEVICTGGTSHSPEICDGLDNDCDATRDDGFTCVLGVSRSCPTTCRSGGRQQCVAECIWGACIPPAEVCNRRDDDCDGLIDEGVTCSGWPR